MQSVIKIGSRESRLAVRQAEMIREEMLRRHPDIHVEIVTMKTTGDRILDRSLDTIGGKGLFVKELDQALADGRIDVAVHSLKDMPMEENRDYPILAFGKREDPRDVLIYREKIREKKEDPFSKATEPLVIGTSSRRRMLQIGRLRSACTFRGIRGNVQTRLRKLEEEGYDATVLAAAGLKRLDMEGYIGRYFSVEEMVPSAGQGILAVQGRPELDWIRELDDPDSRAAALAERQFIRTTGGSCTSPSAVHAQVCGNEIKLTGLYYDETVEMYRKGFVCMERNDAERAGETLALNLMRREKEEQ